MSRCQHRPSSLSHVPSRGLAMESSPMWKLSVLYKLHRPLCSFPQLQPTALAPQNRGQVQALSVLPTMLPHGSLSAQGGPSQFSTKECAGNSLERRPRAESQGEALCLTVGFSPLGSPHPPSHSTVCWWPAGQSQELEKTPAQALGHI